MAKHSQHFLLRHITPAMVHIDQTLAEAIMREPGGEPDDAKVANRKVSRRLHRVESQPAQSPLHVDQPLGNTSTLERKGQRLVFTEAFPRIEVKPDSNAMLVVVQVQLHHMPARQR
ncbi:hypothetical protein TW86_08215 [Halomonas sp. S2151]|nr:hypothetical protein TW86_08215 [Halomonas sp. S2151]